MKRIIGNALTIAIITFSLISCFSPWAGGGNLTITWGGGGRAVNDPNQLKTLDYTVTLKGPGGIIQENFSQGVTRASFNVIPGIWNLTIKGYGAGTTRLLVMGIEQIDVKPKHTFSPINIYNVEEAENWVSLLAYLTQGYNMLNPGQTRMVIIKNDIEFTSSNSQISVNPVVPIILIAEKDVSISRVGDPPGTAGNGSSHLFGPFFSIGTGGVLTLGKPGMGGTITIDNKNKNSDSLVYVSGNLVMNKGVTIQNGYFFNDGNGDDGQVGGGVRVNSGGEFTMYGGVIRNNHVPQLTMGAPADVPGGGVYVESGGTFIRQGGTISGNFPEQEYRAP